LAARVLCTTGDAALIERVYRALAPHGGRLALAAALPVCFGPVDLALGHLAAALGRTAEARAHFAAASAVAEKVGALPYRALAEELLAEVDRRPAKAPVPESLELMREGEVWRVRFGGETLRLKHSKGLVYLAELLRRRGEELHAVELERLGEGAVDGVDESSLQGAGLSTRRSSDAGELLDARAREAYRLRLEELDEHLREAEAFADPGRAASARFEREALAHELARAVGLGGRSRRASASSERARINVQRRLRDLVGRIREQSQALASHLEAYLRTGAYCIYRG
jgi:hypothetical protein